MVDEIIYIDSLMSTDDSNSGTIWKSIVNEIHACFGFHKSRARCITNNSLGPNNEPAQLYNEYSIL